MESRDFVFPSCTKPLAIQVLGSKTDGLSTVTHDECKASLTVEVSGYKLKLAEHPPSKD